MGNFDDTAHVGDNSPRRMSTAMVDGVRTMLAGAVLVTEEPTVVGKGFIAGGDLVAGVRRTSGGDAGVGELLQQRLNPRAQTRTEGSTVERSNAVERRGWTVERCDACSSLLFLGRFPTPAAPPTGQCPLDIPSIVKCNVLAI